MQIKPAWLHKRLPSNCIVPTLEREFDELNIHTICREAWCPNQGECFSKGLATFLILGNRCTRNCRFCAVKHATPLPPDPDEPVRLALEIKKLGLKFAVITSVTRDDLPDGGAGHFSETIVAIRQNCPGVGVEVLIPDFLGDSASLSYVTKALPEVLNHNIETVPRLYPSVRPQANYSRSLTVLRKAKQTNPQLLTKSGIMLGLGEIESEVRQAMSDLLANGCDILTLGQYLCPSDQHYPVADYISPEVFKMYETVGLEMGFASVSAGPFVRSSYMAKQHYQKAKANRLN